MRLNKIQMERAGQWLMERADKLVCPACGGRDWNIEETIFLLASPPDPPGAGLVVAREVGQVKAPPPPVISPLLTVLCSHCACIVLFGANAMGLFSPAAPKPEEGPSDGRGD